MRRLACSLGFLWLAPASAQQCACDGDVTSYCTAATSSAGCSPTLTATGLPSAQLSAGFVLACAGVDGARSGLIVYANSPSTLPWGVSGSSWL